MWDKETAVVYWKAAAVINALWGQCGRLNTGWKTDGLQSQVAGTRQATVAADVTEEVCNITR